MGALVLLAIRGRNPPLEQVLREAGVMDVLREEGATADDVKKQFDRDLEFLLDKTRY